MQVAGNARNETNASPAFVNVFGYSLIPKEASLDKKTDNNSFLVKLCKLYSGYRAPVLKAAVWAPFSRFRMLLCFSHLKVYQFTQSLCSDESAQKEAKQAWIKSKKTDKWLIKLAIICKHSDKRVNDMSSYSADLIILGAEFIYKLMGSVDKGANCLLRFIKQTMKAFLKKYWNYEGARPFGLLGSQIGEVNWTQYACVKVPIFIYGRIYVDQNNYVYKLRPHLISY